MKGYYDKHPERKPKNEPVVKKPLGGPPKHMTDAEKNVWKELAKMLPPGVAKFSDRASFERLVRMFTKDRAGTLRVALEGRLDSLLGKFGMTPSDRARISVAEAPKESKLAAFLKTRPKTAAPGPKTDAQPTLPATTFPQIAN
jgi:hypothetical protein